MRSLLEKFAKVMVQPLMYLSVAGIVLVLGVLLTNAQLIELLPFLNWFPIQLLGNLIYDALMMVINNLSVIFVIGISAALAKEHKHQAAIIGFMSYLIYLTASNTVLRMTGQLAEPSEMLGLIGTGQTAILGIQNVDMSVFGGIIVGCITGFIFNRTYKKEFSGAFLIYSGVRFSFLVMIFVAIAFGVASTYLWPYAQTGISMLASFIKDTGNFGLFVYGFLERLLIPTGLHHLVYTPFQFTDIGGVLQVGDQTIAGAYPIVMTEINMGVDKFSDSIYYMATGFTKMFGYIGIGAAFIYTAKPENRQKTRTLIVPLIIAAALASITEPLDFMFVFISPLLYVIHATIAGLFIALLSIFDVTAFTGGNLITSSLMNVMAGPEATNYPIMFLLGIIQIILYFVVFSFLIKKFEIKTPGREDVVEESEEVVAVAASGSKNGLSDKEIGYLVEGLGGRDNILNVENCFTRLRVKVKDETLVDEALINKIKNSGIVLSGTNIQVVYGLEVTKIRNSVDCYLKGV